MNWLCEPVITIYGAGNTTTITDRSTVCYLFLQLPHCRREIEHQLSHVLQLTLQHLDGICLLLVLKHTTVTHLSLYYQTKANYYTFTLYFLLVMPQLVSLWVTLFKLTCSSAMREVFCSLMMVLLNALCISSICLRYLSNTNAKIKNLLKCPCAVQTFWVRGMIALVILVE